MDASVRKTDALIVQYGTNLGDRADCDIKPLSGAQATALVAALAVPNGGVRLNADGSLTPLAAVAAVDPTAAKRARLAQLRAKGWAAMTVLEKDEAEGLVFELESGG